MKSLLLGNSLSIVQLLVTESLWFFTSLKSLMTRYLMPLELVLYLMLLRTQISFICLLVLPPSAHTVKSTASMFLLNWMSQEEHEYRQWSAAISLGVISSCLHVTDHKQKFENMNALLEVGAIVSIKSIVNADHVVVKKIISSIDPKTQVGGADLGHNWCQVQVQVPVEWDEGLIRPYGVFTTIGDAIEAPIAWHLSLVTPLDFDSI